MVEPVNSQHTLARTQIAEQMQETAKQQNIGDERAFADELTKLERARQKQVQQTDQDQEGLKVREEEQQKQGGGEGKEHEEGAPEQSPSGPPEEITDDPDHHIDITA